MNCWMFNFCLRLEFFCLDFDVDNHLVNPLFRGWGEFRKMVIYGVVVIVAVSVDGFS